MSLYAYLADLCGNLLYELVIVARGDRGVKQEVVIGIKASVAEFATKMLDNSVLGTGCFASLNESELMSLIYDKVIDLLVLSIEVSFAIDTLIVSAKTFLRTGRIVALGPFAVEMITRDLTVFNVNRMELYVKLVRFLVIFLLNSRIPLNAYVLAVRGEVKHCYHTRGSNICIYSLRVDKHLCNDVTVVSFGLSSYYVFTRVVSRKNENDIFVLSYKLIPHMIAVVRATGGCGRTNVVLVKRCTVAIEIRVSSYNNVVSGMRLNNVAYPIKNLIGCTVIKREYKISYLSHGKLLIGIEHIVFVRAVDNILICSVAYVAVKFVCTVVIAPNQRIGYLSVELGYVAHSKLPLCSGVTVGYITQAHNELNIFAVLVIKYIVVYLSKAACGYLTCSFLACDYLSISDDRKGIRVVGDGLFIAYPSVYTVHIVAVTALVLYNVNSGNGRKIVVCDKRIVRGSSVHICRDLICISDVAIHSGRYYSSLEILCVSASDITAENDVGKVDILSVLAILRLLENAVNIAVSLTVCRIANDGNVGNSSVIKRHLIEDYALTVEIQTRLTRRVYLKAYAVSLVVVAENNPAALCHICGKIYSRLKGVGGLFYIRYRSIARIGTEIQAPIAVVDVGGIVHIMSVSAGIVYLGNGRSVIGVIPQQKIAVGRHCLHIGFYLVNAANVAKHCNVHYLSLEVMAVSASAVSAENKVRALGYKVTVNIHKISVNIYRLLKLAVNITISLVFIRIYRDRKM